MSKIFIQNPTSQNVAVNLETSDGGSITNVGPKGAVAVYGGRTSICLAPEASIPDATVFVTEAIDLTGKYVVQVNGEFIPMIFKAEDLSTYFDAQNTSGTGVEFVLFNELNLITCSEGTHQLLLSGGLGEGPWTVTIAGQDVGVFTNDYDIKSFFENNPEYNIRYDIISSGSGSGSGSGAIESIFFNQGDVGYPIQLTTPNSSNVSFVEARMNSTVVEVRQPDVPYKLNFCLNKFDEIPSSQSSAPFTELDTISTTSNGVLNGLNMTVTFPNGETLTGFLSSSQSADGLYIEDTIGKRAEELGYSLAISFGNSDGTINGGEIPPEHTYLLYINNYSNNIDEWHIVSPKLIGFFDRNYYGDVKSIKNGEGDFNVTLGPWNGK